MLNACHQNYHAFTYHMVLMVLKPECFLTMRQMILQTEQFANFANGSHVQLALDRRKSNIKNELGDDKNIGIFMKNYEIWSQSTRDVFERQPNDESPVLEKLKQASMCTQGISPAFIIIDNDYLDYFGKFRQLISFIVYYGLY